MSTTFAQLGVPPFICDALERRGITTPFEIQAATIADGLAGRDVCGRAPTGSGKTLAFGVPLIATAERARPGLPTALVLAPTRELAEQITAELRTFAGRLRVESVYGGVGYGKQLAALRRGVDVLVACPGRLEDLIERGDVALSEVRSVVLDEADRMADMGFMPSVKRLLDQTPRGRSTVLFSATLDGDVAELTRDYQRDPVRHEVGEDTPDITAATHRFVTVERVDRNAAVAQVVNGAWPSIVFTRTRHGADRLAKQLGKMGYVASPIHGGLSQNARQRALDDFADGRVHALVATDVAARGIHVNGVESVIHYDPPEDHKTYVHRAGRTARAGAGGLVVSLVQPDQRKTYRRMQREIGLDEPFATAEVDEVQLDAAVPELAAPTAPEPVRRSGSSRQGSAVSDSRRGDGRARPGHGRPARTDGGDRSRSDRDDRTSRGRDDRDRSSGRAGRGMPGDSDSRGVDGHRVDRHRNGPKPTHGRRAATQRSGGRSEGHADGHRHDAPRPDGRTNGRSEGGRSEGRGSTVGRGEDRPGLSRSGSGGSNGKRGGPSGTRNAAGRGTPQRAAAKRSGKPQANNRRARRAHLQWDA